MTLLEADNFYKQDLKEYQIGDNKEFLILLRNMVTEGYNNIYRIEELQEIIDTIVTWYEIKYPERELDKGTRYYEFENIESIKDYMNFKQLMYRMQSKAIDLIYNRYRSNLWSEYPYMEISFEIKDKIIDAIIRSDFRTGDIVSYDLLDLGLKEEEITLEQLLIKLEKENRKDINYTNLKRVVNNHKCDNKLRKEILKLASLKLLYSKNTIPEKGYERAKNFITEFNAELPDLNLTMDYIDGIMNRNYNITDQIKDTINLDNHKQAIEKIVGMPYSEFDKLDLEEQHKLLEKKNGKKFKYDTRLYIGGCPVDDVNIKDKAKRKIKELFQNKKI